jgi:hypothetical protein
VWDGSVFLTLEAAQRLAWKLSGGGNENVTVVVKIGRVTFKVRWNSNFERMATDAGFTRESRVALEMES